jgi:hypothetical protein
MTTDTGRSDADTGAEDDEDQDDAGTEGDNDEEDEAPATVSKAEFDRVVAQRQKLKADLRKLRDGNGAADEEDDDDLPAAGRRKATVDPKAGAKAARALAAADQKAAGYKTAAITQAARGAFIAAGAKLPDEPEGRRAALAKLSKLLDTSEIDIVDGDVDGLEDQVAEIKRDFPSLFTETKGSGKRVPKVNGKNGGTGGAVKKSSAELLAEQIHGG